MSPQPQTLFSPELISATVQSQLPEGYLMRPLEITDYNKGLFSPFLLHTTKTTQTSETKNTKRLCFVERTSPLVSYSLLFALRHSRLIDVVFSLSLLCPTIPSPFTRQQNITKKNNQPIFPGFYDCLAGLTVVGKVSEASFQEAFAAMLRAATVYHIVVIEDLHESRIVATGTLIVEQKFLRGCGKVFFFPHYFRG